MSRALQNSKRRRRKRKAKGESDRLRYYIRAFNMGEVYEFRQAFIMIDQNGDFFVDQEDLKDALACLSLPSNDSVVDSMMSEVPERRAMNFTMFLGLFGEKMIGMNSEDEIRDAFAVFDEEGTGKIHKDRLRELLTTMGDCFTDAKVDEMLREAPVDAAGNVDYVVFSHILKHGAKKECRTPYQQQ